MEIKARLSERKLTQEFIEILCTPKDTERIIEVLTTLKKRTKLDRYEEMVVNDLLDAFINPEQRPAQIATVANGTTPSFPQVYKSSVQPEADKSGIVKMLKKKMDPRDEKEMSVFINESLIFGKNQFGITADPVDGGEESFYDWLLLNNIINPDGSPTKRV